MFIVATLAAMAASPTLCVDGERDRFSCALGDGEMLSVCEADHTMDLRTGKPSQPNLQMGTGQQPVHAQKDPITKQGWQLRTFHGGLETRVLASPSGGVLQWWAGTRLSEQARCAYVLRHDFEGLDAPVYVIPEAVRPWLGIYSRTGQRLDLFWIHAELHIWGSPTEPSVMSIPRESLEPAFKGVLKETKTGWELKQKSCKLTLTRGPKNHIEVQQSGKCGGQDVTGSFYQGEGE